MGFKERNHTDGRGVRGTEELSVGPQAMCEGGLEMRDAVRERG